MSCSVIPCLQNCIKNSPLQTIPQQVISKSVFFPPHYIPSVHPCVCRCVGVVSEKYNIMFIYSFGGVMCTFLLIVQRTMCSPLWVRYHTIEVTAIYTEYSQSIPVGNLGKFQWEAVETELVCPAWHRVTRGNFPSATNCIWFSLFPPMPAWNHIYQSTPYAFPTFHTYLQCVCFLLSTGGLCMREIFQWACIPGPLNIKHRACPKFKKKEILVHTHT